MSRPGHSRSKAYGILNSVVVRRIGGMADAGHSKCSARKGVRVQVPHPARKKGPSDIGGPFAIAAPSYVPGALTFTRRGARPRSPKCRSGRSADVGPATFRRIGWGVKYRTRHCRRGQPIMVAHLSYLPFCGARCRTITRWPTPRQSEYRRDPAPAFCLRHFGGHGEASSPGPRARLKSATADSRTISHSPSCGLTSSPDAFGRSPIASHFLLL